MDPQLQAIFITWAQLTPQQQNQLHDMIGAFRDLPEHRRKAYLARITDAFASLDIGPLTTPCPRCGR